MTELPKEIREAVVYSAKNWPRTLNAQALLNELNALAQLVYTLAKTEPLPAPPVLGDGREQEHER